MVVEGAQSSVPHLGIAAKVLGADRDFIKDHLRPAATGLLPISPICPHPSRTPFPVRRAEVARRTLPDAENLKRNLPAPTSELIGREVELSEAERSADGSSARHFGRSWRHRQDRRLGLEGRASSANPASPMGCGSPSSAWCRIPNFVLSKPSPGALRLENRRAARRHPERVASTLGAETIFFAGAR